MEEEKHSGRDGEINNLIKLFKNITTIYIIISAVKRDKKKLDNTKNAWKQESLESQENVCQEGS